MATEKSRPQTTLQYEVTAGPEGRVEIVGPFRCGERLTVLILPESRAFDDLTAAASSSLGFWDNPLDDEDWNEAPAG